MWEQVMAVFWGIIVATIFHAYAIKYYYDLKNYYLEKNIQAVEVILGLCRHIKLKHGEDILEEVKKHVEIKDES